MPRYYQIFTSIYIVDMTIVNWFINPSLFLDIPTLPKAPPWLVARHDRRAWHCCRRSRPPFRRRFWMEVAGGSQGKSVEKWWKTIGKTWEKCGKLGKHEKQTGKRCGEHGKSMKHVGRWLGYHEIQFWFSGKNKLYFLTNQPSSISCIIWAPVEIIYCTSQ